MITVKDLLEFLQTKDYERTVYYKNQELKISDLGLGTEHFQKKQIPEKTLFDNIEEKNLTNK